jgi:hypothetical protein
MMSDEQLAAETPEQRRERYRSISFGQIGNGKPAHLKRIPYRPPVQPDRTEVKVERPGGFKVPLIKPDGDVLTKHELNNDTAKWRPMIERSQKAAS